MSKSTKWGSSKKAPKNEFHALLCGTSKPILEQWKAEANGSPHPPWAPKPQHTQSFDDADLTYMAKIKALNEMSEYIYSRNLKLKYRLNAVAKEIKCLKRVKRVLCRRLFEHNSKELIGTYLEIPDSETSTIAMDQIIGDVVNDVVNMPAQSKVTPAPVVKKKRKEQKLSQNAKSSPVPTTSSYSKEDEINQHIISVIDNVANTSYTSSNGPSSSKKPRKQNLAALTSPTKDALIFTNGSNSNNGNGLAAHSLNNNTFAAQNSQSNVVKMEMPSPPTTYVAKQPPSTFVVQNKDFPAPTHLPIYVKRELLCPPERRDQTTVIGSNSGNIRALSSIQSNSSSSFAASPNPTSSLQTLLTTNNRADSYASNGQNSTESTIYLPPKQSYQSTSIASSSPSIPLEKTPSPNNVPSKAYYASKFNEDRGSNYGGSALKSLAQTRISTSGGQMSSQNELCAASVQSLANSNV